MGRLTLAPADLSERWAKKEAEISALRSRVAELERINAQQHKDFSNQARDLEDALTRVAELEELLRGVGANRYWEGRYRDEAKRVAVLEGALRRLVWHFDKGYTPRRKDWEAARAALANAPACPAGGYTGQPSTEEPMVENCVKAGVCGCDVGAAYARGYRDAIVECMAR